MCTRHEAVSRRFRISSHIWQLTALLLSTMHCALDARLLPAASVWRQPCCEAAAQAPNWNSTNRLTVTPKLQTSSFRAHSASTVPATEWGSSQGTVNQAAGFRQLS